MTNKTQLQQQQDLEIWRELVSKVLFMTWHKLYQQTAVVLATSPFLPIKVEEKSIQDAGAAFPLECLFAMGWNHSQRIILTYHIGQEISEINFQSCRLLSERQTLVIRWPEISCHTDILLSRYFQAWSDKSCQAIVRQSSGNIEAVIRQSSDSCQGLVGQLSSSH